VSTSVSGARSDSSQTTCAVTDQLPMCPGRAAPTAVTVSPVGTTAVSATPPPPLLIFPPAAKANVPSGHSAVTLLT
jgi:hypothetical protein